MILGKSCILKIDQLDIFEDPRCCFFYPDHLVTTKEKPIGTSVHVQEKILYSLTISHCSPMKSIHITFILLKKKKMSTIHFLKIHLLKNSFTL